MEPRAKVEEVAGPCTVSSYYCSPSVQQVPPVQKKDNVSQTYTYVAGGTQYEDDSVDNGVSKPPAEQNEEDSGVDSDGSDIDEGNDPENTSEQQARQGNGEYL